MAVEHDFSAELGVPVGDAAGVDGGDDLVVLGCGDEALFAAAVGGFEVGVVEAEGEVVFGFGVFVADVEAAFGGFAVAFDLFVTFVAAGDAGVGFDEAVGVEEFELAGGFVDDEAGGLDGHGNHLCWAIGRKQIIDRQGDDFADSRGQVPFGQAGLGGGESVGVEAGLGVGEADAREVVVAGAGDEGVEAEAGHEALRVGDGGAGVDADGIDEEGVVGNAGGAADGGHGEGFGLHAAGGVVDGAGDHDVADESLAVEVGGELGAGAHGGGGGAVVVDAFAEDDGEVDWAGRRELGVVDEAEGEGEGEDGDHPEGEEELGAGADGRGGGGGGGGEEGADAEPAESEEEPGEDGQEEDAGDGERGVVEAVLPEEAEEADGGGGEGDEEEGGGQQEEPGVAGWQGAGGPGDGVESAEFGADEEGEAGKGGEVEEREGNAGEVRVAGESQPAVGDAEEDGHGAEDEEGGMDEPEAGADEAERTGGGRGCLAGEGHA